MVHDWSKEFACDHIGLELSAGGETKTVLRVWAFLGAVFAFTAMLMLDQYREIAHGRIQEASKHPPAEFRHAYLRLVSQSGVPLVEETVQGFLNIAQAVLNGCLRGPEAAH